MSWSTLKWSNLTCGLCKLKIKLNIFIKPTKRSVIFDIICSYCASVSISFVCSGLYLINLYFMKWGTSTHTLAFLIISRSCFWRLNSSITFLCLCTKSWASFVLLPAVFSQDMVVDCVCCEYIWDWDTLGFPALLCDCDNPTLSCLCWMVSWVRHDWVVWNSSLIIAERQTSLSFSVVNPVQKHHSILRTPIFGPNHLICLYLCLAIWTGSLFKPSMSVKRLLVLLAERYCFAPITLLQ